MNIIGQILDSVKINISDEFLSETQLNKYWSDSVWLASGGRDLWTHTLTQHTHFHTNLHTHTHTHTHTCTHTHTLRNKIKSIKVDPLMGFYKFPLLILVNYSSQLQLSLKPSQKIIVLNVSWAPRSENSSSQRQLSSTVELLVLNVSWAPRSENSWLVVVSGRVFWSLAPRIS